MDYHSNIQGGQKEQNISCTPILLLFDEQEDQGPRAQLIEMAVDN
jgi:hypothetical protein